jgi:hypothetical protein
LTVSQANVRQVPTHRPKPEPPSANRQGLLWTFDNLCSYLEREGVKFRVTNRYGDGDGGCLTNAEEKATRAVFIRLFDTEAEALKQPPEKPGYHVKVWGRFRLTSTSESFFRQVSNALR